MLRSVPIGRRQVDLVAKESETAARHTRHEPTTCWRVLVHGMRLEGAQQRAWCRLRRQVQGDDVDVGQASKSREDDHGLAGARWTTQHHRPLVLKPCIQQILVPHRVDRRDHRIGRAQRTRIDVHLSSAPRMERRVRRGLDVHIQQRGIRHIVDVGVLPHGIGDHRTHLVRRIACSRPHERQDERAAREHRRVVGAERKVWVVRIVRQHLAHRAAKERHERRQGTNG